MERLQYQIIHQQKLTLLHQQDYQLVPQELYQALLAEFETVAVPFAKHVAGVVVTVGTNGAAN